MSQPDTTIEIKELLEHIARSYGFYTDADMDAIEPRAIQALESYINNKVKEARIDENQRWADGYASALYDHPDIDDPQSLQAAKLDFEDRIKELKPTTKETP